MCHTLRNDIWRKPAYSDVWGGSYVVSDTAAVVTRVHIVELILKFLKG
jgi:hypothetical protein